MLNASKEQISYRGHALGGELFIRLLCAHALCVTSLDVGYTGMSSYWITPAT
jgi:hypothetical protein